MYRLLALLFVFTYIAYYVTVFLDIAGIIRLTNRKVSFIRLLIPFYFWIAPFHEKDRKVKILLGDK